MKRCIWLALALGLAGGCGDSRGKGPALQTALTETQARLHAATAEVAALQNQLAVARAEINALRPLAAKARTLPIRIQRRQPAGGTNAVYQLQNLSDQTLAVRIRLHNTLGNYSKSLTCALPAMRAAPPFEIGATNDWPTATGDVLEMTSQGYDALTITF